MCRPSRALSPEKRSLISDEVLRVVEEAAQRLGYRPNRAASALRTGRTHTIGVLVPDITNAVFPPILQGIEASAAARGYFVFVTNVVDPALARPVLERMLAQRVDGVILATATRDDPLVDFVAKAGMTAVLVNRADETGRLPAVVSDDRLAMKLAVDHLVGLGHKRIAHLAGPQNIPTGVGRRLGLEQALRDHRMKPLRVVECESYSREAGAAAMRQMLEAGPRRRPWCAATTSWRWAPTTRCARPACACRRTSRSPATTTCRWSTWSTRRSPPSACRTASLAGARPRCCSRRSTAARCRHRPWCCGPSSWCASRPARLPCADQRVDVLRAAGRRGGFASSTSSAGSVSFHDSVK